MSGKAKKAPAQSASDHQKEVDELAQANVDRWATYRPAEVHSSAAAGDSSVSVHASGGVVFVEIDGNEARLDREELIQLRKLLDEAFQVVA